VTFRRDGSVVATYPERAKVHNLRRDPRACVLVHSDDRDGPYVQPDGTAEVIGLPDSVEPLVDESLIRLTVERWGPIASGGFPPGRSPS
jgi:hypothetical protein